MKKLLIVGAGPMGRVAFSYASEVGISVKGFLDSRPGALEDFNGYPPIISGVEEYQIEEGDVFVVALGDPDEKRRYVEQIAEKGGKFCTIIHPRAYVGMNVEIGEGTIVAPNSSITNDVKIGRHVLVGVNAVVSHDSHVGDFVSISPGCCITGGCKIGAGSFLGVQSTVIPHCELGFESPVYAAAGAVVTKSFSSGRLMGVPAIRK